MISWREALEILLIQEKEKGALQPWVLDFLFEVYFSFQNFFFVKLSYLFLFVVTFAWQCKRKMTVVYSCSKKPACLEETSWIGFELCCK